MNSQDDINYLLAGEGGGSKTILCLLKKTGDFIFRMEVGGVAAIRDGVLPVKRTLKEGIYKLCKETGIPNEEISHCYFLLGGPNQKEVDSVLNECLPAARTTVGREADGNLIMNCVPYLNCMAAIMAGTGTVAVGEFDKKRYFGGGWGYEFDDAGSGARIGKDALQAFLQFIDRRKTKTLLVEIFNPLLHNINIDSFAGRMELKQKIHELDRRQLASYAPLVYKSFQRGDSAAKEIISHAAEDIAILAAAVVPKNTGLDEIGILGLGGIFKLGNEFRKMCSEYLKVMRPECKLVFKSNFDLAEGACLMVLQMAGADEETLSKYMSDNNWDT
jgi:N-acetylglucosamine kinase-like BadF-type ATPase